MNGPRYIERDPATKEVVGHFNCCQPGTAEELVPGDHPDLLAYRARRVAADEAARAQAPSVEQLAADVAALTARLAALERK